MDLYWTTKSGIGTRAMATMALEKANQIVSSDSDVSHSSRSSNCDCTECHLSSPSSSLRPPLPNIPISPLSPSLYIPPSPNRSMNNVTTISVPVSILKSKITMTIILILYYILHVFIFDLV